MSKPTAFSSNISRAAEVLPACFLLKRCPFLPFAKHFRPTVGFNGVVAVPIMFLMMLMAQNAKVMGDFTLNARQRVFGWLGAAVMLAAAVGLFATWGREVS